MDRNVGAVGTTGAKLGRYEVEERLNLAERRYARARDQLARLRDECELLERHPTSGSAALEAARVRLQNATARCASIRLEIAELERLLE